MAATEVVASCAHLVLSVETVVSFAAVLVYAAAYPMHICERCHGRESLLGAAAGIHLTVGAPPYAVIDQ